MGDLPLGKTDEVLDTCADLRRLTFWYREAGHGCPELSARQSGLGLL